LDELTEFRRDAIEALRQPLEDGRIVVTRSGLRDVGPDLQAVRVAADVRGLCMTSPASSRRVRLVLAAQYVAVAISLVAIVFILLRFHNPVFLVLGLLLWGGMLFLASNNTRRFRALRRRREMDSGEGG
jgi:hypothetical protein